MTITNITERERELSARVDELEAELEKARLHIKHIGNDALRAENAELRAELAAVRNQQPIGYFEKHLIESGRKIQLCNLTKTRLWADSVPVYLAAGAQPRCPYCDGTGDVHSIDGEWRGECDCGAGAQYVESYGENHRPERLAAMRKTVCDGEAAKLALEYISWQAFGECRIGEGPIPEAKDVVRALRQALAEPGQPARAQMTQAVAEELAHRRCRRYIMIDTEAPYQFDGHTLMYFVADIEKATIKESLTVESNSARVPFLPGEYENTLLKTEKARKQL